LPYILQDRRDKLDPIIDELYHMLGDLEKDNFDDKNNTQGNLNYVITRLLLKVYTPVNYQAINDVVGLLNCVETEFNRTVAGPYEAQKSHDNGEVEI